MDLSTVIVAGVAPSIVVLGAGICRAMWVWARQQVFLHGAAPLRAPRTRI